MVEKPNPTSCTYCSWSRASAAAHSQSLYNMFAAIPGVKVVVPSNPYDAKGLLMSAIQEDNLVVFSEDKTLLGQKVMFLKNLIL